MVSKHFWLMVEVHFWLTVNQFLVVVQEDYQEIYLTVIFLDSWVFDNFILAEARAAHVAELFAKTSWRFVAYLSVSNVL